MKHTVVLPSLESLSSSVLDTMMSACDTNIETITEVVEKLNRVYAGNIYIQGVFSCRDTYRGAELLFVGTICGEPIQHTLWWYTKTA